MSRGPRRLKEDQDFQWETGCDLADEQLIVGDYDLSGMRQALLEQIEVASAGGVGDGVPVVRSAPGASPRWLAPKPLVAALVGLSLLGGGYWLGAQSGHGHEAVATPGADPTPTGRAVPLPPAQLVPSPGQADELDLPPRPDVSERPRALEHAKPRPGGSLRAVGEPPPPAASAEGTAEGPQQIEAAPAVGLGPSVAPPQGGAGAEPPQPVAGSAEPAVAVTPAGSDIPAELRLYDPADDALKAGAYRQAVAGFEAYLEAWPEGGLRDEAELGMLRALHGANDAQGTAALAERLQHRSALSGHREEILRLRAESLSVLGRCKDALWVAEDLPARIAGPIKRSCRSQRQQR